MKNQTYSGPMDVLGTDAVVYGTSNMLDDTNGCEYPFLVLDERYETGRNEQDTYFSTSMSHLCMRSLFIGGEYTTLVAKGFGYVWIGVGVLDEGFCFEARHWCR